MKVYIVGISGTFMAGFALLMRHLGWEVIGSDRGVYPPMSDQLNALNIPYHNSFDCAHAKAAQADCYIIGNAITRGNPIFEWILNDKQSYASAPDLLKRYILRDKHVIAVSGTHGKTTTTGLLIHVLTECGYNPSYLMGGALRNGSYSAALTESQYFVIEADEYDTALFDKRSKFIHYQPDTLIINNIEYDHADIFPHYAAVENTFHHLLRTMASQATIIHHNQPRIQKLLMRGCYSQQLLCGRMKNADLRLLRVRTHHTAMVQTLTLRYADEQHTATIPLIGAHNRENILSAALAAVRIGIPLDKALTAMTNFAGVKRRQACFLHHRGAQFIEDFGHHPTAIRRTINALRPYTKKRLWAVVDPRSNSIKLGVMKCALLVAMQLADKALLYLHDELAWQNDTLPKTIQTHQSTASIVQQLVQQVAAGDTVVLFSNGNFDDITKQLVTATQL